MPVHVEIDPRLRWARDGSIIAKPVEIRVSRFSDGAVREFQGLLEEACSTGQPVIPLYVDSFGGSAYGLLSMLDALESIRGSITIATIATGKAFSAGAFLLAAGDPGARFVSENASVMIHEMSSWGSGGKNVEIQADAKECGRMNRLLFDRLDRNCDKPRNYFSDLIHDCGHADLFLSPKQAVKHNLAQTVGIPHLALFANVEYAFGLPSKPKPHRHTKACKHGRA